MTRSPTRRCRLLVLLLVLAVPLGLVALWRQSDRMADVQSLDYVYAQHDEASGDVYISAAFEAGSWFVLDSCRHEYLPDSGELRVELRSRLLVSVRGERRATFHIPFHGGPDAAPALAARTPTVRLRSRTNPEGDILSVSPVPPDWRYIPGAIDSRGR